MWKGEVVSRDNHPALVDEELFWAVQELVRSKQTKTWSKTEVLPLSGLIFCGNHDPQYEKTQRIYASRANSRYECQGLYKYGSEAGMCFNVGNRILDIPICQFVISECSYTNYLEQVLAHLNNTYEQEKERVAARKRALERLTAEIDNLTSHLAITKSPEQGALILEEIEARLNQRRSLEKDPVVVTRVMAQVDMDNVREFLSNIGSNWDTIPDAMKNEFLSIILDGIWIHHQGTDLIAEIRWTTGLIQKLWIRRPHAPRDESHQWSAEEQDRLRKYFALKTISEIMQMFPNRSWTAIVHAAKKLGLRRKRMGSQNQWSKQAWTNEEEQVVRRYYTGEIDIHEACELTGRTQAAIRNRGTKELGLKIPKAIYRMKKAVEWGIEDDGLGAIRFI